MSYEPRLDKLGEEFAELKQLVRQLLTQAPIGHSSITEGRLRVASEEGLVVEGSALVTGLLRVIGRVIVQGLGILEVSSLIDLTGMLRVVGEIAVPAGGKITVGDIRIQDGRIYVGSGIVIDGGTNQITVGAGANQISIDGATGRITSGNVRIEGGKIYVGTGSNTVVIDGAAGEIIAGSMRIDPTSNGGSVKFAGGPEVYAAGDTLYLYSTAAGSFIEVGSTVKINGPGARWIEVDEAGIRFVGLPTITVSDSGGHNPGALYIGANGRAFRVVPD